MNAFYESSRLHIDKELYKEVKKLIEAKKQAFFDKNSQKVLANQRNYNGSLKLQCNR